MFGKKRDVKTRIDKILKVFLLVLPAVVGGSIFLANHKTPITIYPNPRTEINWQTDKTFLDGKSEKHLYQHTNDSITFSFTMNADGERFPFSFIWFAPRGPEYFDLSGYKYMEIEAKIDTDLSVDRPLTIPLHLSVDVPNYSHPGRFNSYRILRYEVPYDKAQKKYRVELNKMMTPSWWWQQHPGLSENAAGAPDYSKVRAIYVLGSGLIPIGTRQALTIYRVSFTGSNWPIVWGVLVAICCYAFIFLLTRSSFKHKLKLPSKPIELSNVADEETRNLVRYISENYFNEGLAIETVADATKISESKVSNLLKASSNLTFKKYLNQVRLQEACRLLQDTDRPISEIAYTVGYSNISHFNRVFKETEGCSPNEYRKALKTDFESRAMANT